MLERVLDTPLVEQVFVYRRKVVIWGRWQKKEKNNSRVNNNKINEKHMEKIVSEFRVIKFSINGVWS